MSESQRIPEQDLRKIIESAVAEVVGLPRDGLSLVVDRVHAIGHPPTSLRVWVTLHFLPAGSPFCCGEPGCHLGLFGDRLAALQERVGRAMGFEHAVTLDFGGQIAVEYHPGVAFNASKRVT